MVPIVGIAINLAVIGILSAVGYSHAKDLGKKLHKGTPSQKETVTDYSDYRWPVSKKGEIAWDIEVTKQSVTELRNIKEQYRPYNDIEPDDDTIDCRVPKEILSMVVSSTGIHVEDTYSKWDIIALLNDTDRKILMLLAKQHIEDIFSL